MEVLSMAGFPEVGGWSMLDALNIDTGFPVTIRSLKWIAIVIDIYRCLQEYYLDGGFSIDNAVLVVELDPVPVGAEQDRFALRFVVLE